MKCIQINSLLSAAIKSTLICRRIQSELYAISNYTVCTNIIYIQSFSVYDFEFHVTIQT